MLARELGMTVGEMGRRMTWHEFVTWMLFSNEEVRRRNAPKEMTGDEMLNAVKVLNKMYGGKEVRA